MEAAITAFSNGIPLTVLDPTLLNSKALTLADGIVAAGGNRYEQNVIALYEFKTGTGAVAYDTSGVEPAIDMNFNGNVTWVAGYAPTVAALQRPPGLRSQHRPPLCQCSVQHCQQACLVLG